MEIQTTREQLDELVQQLPVRYHEDAIRYMKLLMLEESTRKPKRMRMQWVGALKDIRDQYTSIELQKEALDLMEESAMKNVSR